MSEEQSKSKHLVVSLITSLGLGGGTGAAVSYYIQEAQGKAIEKLDDNQVIMSRMIFQELREMNTRLSRIEGRLEGK